MPVTDTRPEDLAPAGDSVVLDIKPDAKERGRIPLPENRPFRYWADPTRVKHIKGRPELLPVKVHVEPGLQGTPSDADPTFIDGYQSNKLGRVAVPMDMEVQAWGKTVKGYVIRKDIGRDRLGKQLYHFHDVWTRHTVFGRRVVTEFDQDGFDDFCRRVGKLPGIGELHPVIVAAERARVQRMADEHRRMAHQSPGSAQVAAQISAQLEGDDAPTPSRGGSGKKA